MATMHFDLPDLRLFIHIAESPSLTQGARKAFLSPAAASARIKALENQLGSRLLPVVGNHVSSVADCCGEPEKQAKIGMGVLSTKAVDKSVG